MCVCARGGERKRDFVCSTYRHKGSIIIGGGGRGLCFMGGGKHLLLTIPLLFFAVYVVVVHMVASFNRVKNTQAHALLG